MKREGLGLNSGLPTPLFWSIFTPPRRGDTAREGCHVGKVPCGGAEASVIDVEEIGLHMWIFEGGHGIVDKGLSETTKGTKDTKGDMKEEG